MSHSNRRPAVIVLVLSASVLASHPQAARPQTGSVTEGVPKEAVDLHAKVIASVPAGTRQWIKGEAKRVARTPGAENTPGFLNSVKSQAGAIPDGDVMSVSFAIFEESVEQANADKRYFLERLAEMNRISQALGDYLGYLNNSSDKLTGKNDSDGLCDQGRAETRKGMKDLQALQSRIPSGPSPTIHEPTTIGALKAAIRVAAADLRTRAAWAQKSTQSDSAGLQAAQARAKELFPKMMETMRKVPPNRYMKRVPPIIK